MSASTGSENYVGGPTPKPSRKRKSAETVATGLEKETTPVTPPAEPLRPDPELEGSGTPMAPSGSKKKKKRAGERVSPGPPAQAGDMEGEKKDENCHEKAKKVKSKNSVRSPDDGGSVRMRGNKDDEVDGVDKDGPPQPQPEPIPGTSRDGTGEPCRELDDLPLKERLPLPKGKAGKKTHQGPRKGRGKGVFKGGRPLRGGR